MIRVVSAQVLDFFGVDPAKGLSDSQVWILLRSSTLTRTCYSYLIVEIGCKCRLIIILGCLAGMVCIYFSLLLHFRDIWCVPSYKGT